MLFTLVGHPNLRFKYFCKRDLKVTNFDPVKRNYLESDRSSNGQKAVQEVIQIGEGKHNHQKEDKRPFIHQFPIH